MRKRPAPLARVQEALDNLNRTLTAPLEGLSPVMRVQLATAQAAEVGRRLGRVEAQLAQLERLRVALGARLCTDCEGEGAVAPSGEYGQLGPASQSPEPGERCRCCEGLGWVAEDVMDRRASVPLAPLSELLSGTAQPREDPKDREAKLVETLMGALADAFRQP